MGVAEGILTYYVARTVLWSLGIRRLLNGGGAQGLPSMSPSVGHSIDCDAMLWC